jgi:hypothetical protein
MLKPSNMKIDNQGTNEGVIVGLNQGTINFLLQEKLKIPSLISSVVKALGSVCVDNDDVESSLDLNMFKPDDKIEYNCVIKYKTS